MKPRLAFIGAGRMGGAMVRGILRTASWQAVDIACTSARDGTADALAEETGVTCTYDWEELVTGADWIVLACKPQQLGDLPLQLPLWSKGKGILSILAGIPLARLRLIFPDAANIVRAMPNTPGMIGAGITAFSPLLPLLPPDEQTVRKLLSALGEVLQTEESLLNAVTGLSGSGPAYVFEFVAALRDGGIAAGLDPPTAYRLALKTVQGAAALLEAVPQSPETHRDWVSSPGGTTLAGLRVMHQAGFRQILTETIRAATHRADQLASS